MRKLLQILSVIAICGGMVSCQHDENKVSRAEVFFDFVNREINAIEITRCNQAKDLFREDEPVQIAASSTGKSYLYWTVSFVPWLPEERPEEDMRYLSAWKIPGNAMIEKQILDLYKDTRVSSFSHIEYREVGLEDLTISSLQDVTAITAAGRQEFSAGESLNALFEIVSIKTSIHDRAYDSLLIRSSGRKVSRQPDRISIEDYLHQSLMAPPQLCLRLKASLWTSLQDCRITVRLSNGKTFEAVCP